jgi:Zn-dependent protease with chaperone function
MTFLLMVFLAGVCLFETYPTAVWAGPVWLAWLVTLLSLGLLGLHAAWISWRVRTRLVQQPTQLDRHLARYDRERIVHGAFILIVYLLVLSVLGWGHAVRSLGGGHGTEILLLAPFLLAQLLSWACFYDADRAIHATTHRLLDGAPFTHSLEVPQSAVPSFGSRWAYVGFQFQQKLALVLIPLFLLIARQELFRLLPEGWASGTLPSYLLTALGLTAIFLGMPLLIRAVLGLRPLEPGPLRDRLEATARRLGFRLSDILVWNTRNGMANAMIVGLVPWVRYVVFTDKLLEEFTPEEVQAVFGHELGHVKHQHMLFYMLFLTLSMIALGLLTDSYLLPGLAFTSVWLAESWPGLVPMELATWFDPKSGFSLVMVLGMLLVYVYVVFGFLSRHCERQADVYGCRAVSCGRDTCSGHDEKTSYSPEGALCQTGVRTFTRALDRVALLNGIDREKPGFFQSWQHSTIARRVQFLLRMLLDPRSETRFQRRLATFKWSLVTGLSALLIALLAGFSGQ